MGHNKFCNTLFEKKTLQLSVQLTGDMLQVAWHVGDLECSLVHTAIKRGTTTETRSFHLDMTASLSGLLHADIKHAYCHSLL